MKSRKLKIAGLLMCLAAVTMMVSCNDEERISRKLVGTWAFVSANYEGSTAEEQSWYQSNYVDVNKGKTMTFSDDGILKGEINIRTTFLLEKSKEYRWSIIGDSLYISGSPFEIQQLTNSNLKILKPANALLATRGVSMEFIKQ